MARKRPLAAVALAVALLCTAWATASCRALSKEELTERLLALEKNAPARAAGLERLAVPVEWDGSSHTLELVHLAVVARPPIDPQRAPVVLVHGTPSTLFSWVEPIFGGPGFDGLAGERDVYALEIVGHGLAPGELEPCSFELCARFVAAALEALDVGPVHLVGSSYGGEFVWRAALDRPELVRSLTLIDSSGYERADGDWLPEEVAMRENPLADLGWLLNSRARIEVALAPHFRAIPPERIEEFFLVCANPHNWRAMVDLARDENGTREHELGGLAVPTLVLWGADDVAYGLDAYGRRFAADIPGAELVVLPETGHYPHEERPADVVDALGRFFESVESKP